ncbi:carboxymuconolactone decarboxylase family protein [Mycolicibacterium sp. 3033]|nr:carboxymuconolactone decarboxylase family protein [Mycolicibacterium aurantiacum]
MRRRRGGRLTPLDDALLHSQPLAAGWNELLGAVRSHVNLAPAVREVAICRVAVLNGAAYEWDAHAPLALSHGVTAAQLDAVRGGGDPAVLTDVQRLVIDYTDAMTSKITVDDELSDKTRKMFGDRQFVELTATVAAYNMVSRFLVALQIGE